VSTAALKILADRTKESAQATEALAEATDKAAASHREFVNFLGEREIEAHAEVIMAKEADDEAYRAFRNDIGLRMMEEDAARMKQEEQAYAAHVAAMMQAKLTLVGMGGAPGLSQSGTVTFGPDGQMQGGGGAQFYEGSPVTVFGGEDAPATWGTGASGTRVPSSFGPMPSGGWNITVDARESMYDTPAGVQRMADKVGDAMVKRMSSFGSTLRVER